MPVFTANIPGLLRVGDKIEIGGKIKENARKRYKSGTTASTTKLFFPSAAEAYGIVGKMVPSSITTQVLSGHGGFSAYLHRFKCADDPSCFCEPGVDQTVQHILFRCPAFSKQRMSVNLCAQEGEEPRDVVLHFDVRFHRDNIISLSRKNGIWIGSGNYDTNYNMFVPGTIFRIIFEIKDTDVITIYCQGKFHSNFLPKIPLSMARYIVAWADVERITHCYFLMGNKAVSGDEPTSASTYTPQSPRAAMVAGDGNRCSRQHASNKKSAPGSPQLHSSNESSDDEKPRPKAEGRADRFFYDTLMCQQDKFSPEAMKFRRENSAGRGKIDFIRKYRDMTDTEKNDTEDYSEEIASKNMDTSVADSEDLQELSVKKRGRRGKFAPFSQVVNFMGKTGKRN